MSTATSQLLPSYDHPEGLQSHSLSLLAVSIFRVRVTPCGPTGSCKVLSGLVSSSKLEEELSKGLDAPIGTTMVELDSRAATVAHARGRHRQPHRRCDAVASANRGGGD